MNKKMIPLYILIVLTLACTGCAPQAKKVLTKNNYLIAKTYAIKNPGQKTFGIASVRKFGISESFSGASLIYKIGENTYESDFYNKFLTTPAAMLTEQTHQWLRDQRIFENVLTKSSIVKPDFVLEGFISEFYGDYTSDKKQPEAVIAIQFVLVNTETDEIVFQKQYKKTSKAPKNAPAELVKHYEIALMGIFHDLGNDMQKALQ